MNKLISGLAYPVFPLKYDWAACTTCLPVAHPVKCIVSEKASVTATLAGELASYLGRRGRFSCSLSG